MANDTTDGMAMLSFEECRHLLRAGGVGIIALRGVEAPVLRPVNFALHERSSNGARPAAVEVLRNSCLLIRTGEGRILEAAIGGEPASFVISAIDGLEHTGWSVVVTGRLVDRSRVEGIDAVPLRPWARAEKNRFVGLSIEEISGRRIAGGVVG